MSTAETVKLTPPDKKQCQAEKPNGQSFMTLGGGHKMVRCTATPVVVAKENKPGEDGRRGSMSLCESCLIVMQKQMGKDFATFTPLNQKEKPKLAATLALKMAFKTLPAQIRKDYPYKLETIEEIRETNLSGNYWIKVGFDQLWHLWVMRGGSWRMTRKERVGVRPQNAVCHSRVAPQREKHVGKDTKVSRRKS